MTTGSGGSFQLYCSQLIDFTVAEEDYITIEIHGATLLGSVSNLMFAFTFSNHANNMAIC